MIASLSSGFSLIATALAVIGLYGVMAYTVTRRTREIGIRVALGASRRRLVGQLLTENVLLTLFGGVLGLALSFGGVRILDVLEPQLFPRTV